MDVYGSQDRHGTIGSFMQRQHATATFTSIFFPSIPVLVPRWLTDTATNTVCDVRVSDGSGSVRPAEKKGTRALVFDLAGVNDGTTIQAFAGSRPFTEPLSVARRSFGALGAENNRLLSGGDSWNVCQIAGHPVKVLPLSKGFGNYQPFPQMSAIHGLAVHINTGGNESLEFLKTSFEGGKSTHFACEKGNSGLDFTADLLRTRYPCDDRKAYGGGRD